MKATFRGVPFFLSTAEVSGGRRGVTHEYPGRDEPFREDLGRQGRSFPVEGYVVGADYAAQRDALLAALEGRGPGELVHPRFGTRRVAVVGFSIRESSTEGRLASFSVEFIETPAQAAQPASVPDIQAAALTSVGAVQASITEEFLATYTPAISTIQVEAQLGNVAESVKAVAAELVLTTQERAELLRDVARLGAGLSRDAAALVESLLSILWRLPGGLMEVYSFSPGERPPSTAPNRVAEQSNFDAVHRLVQQLSLVRAVELALVESFESADAALERRTELLEAVDEQAAVVSDSVYPALVALRADVAQAVPPPGAGLPRLSSYTPPATVPSLVLAHRLYGDALAEADVVRRNRPMRPGFLTGGVELEVLSRG
jgi:prophage DNA circulation protein